MKRNFGILAGAALAMAAGACFPSLDDLDEGCREPNTKECGGRCVRIDNPDYGCSPTKCASCDVAHATAVACSDGQCRAKSCDEDFKLCDGVCRPKILEYGCALDGCQPCFVPNAKMDCDNGGACVINSCLGQLENCNGKIKDGCEVNLLQDIDNCGECGNQCGEQPHAEVRCSGGRCVIRRCDAGFWDCDENQEGCETECPDGSPCDDSVCDSAAE